ncbi:MAG: hypothetical protein AAF533_23760 [Acidobacteriota bacterium]
MRYLLALFLRRVLSPWPPRPPLVVAQPGPVTTLAWATAFLLALALVLVALSRLSA